jgi:hypothetical protein
MARAVPQEPAPSTAMRIVGRDVSANAAGGSVRPSTDRGCTSREASRDVLR